MKINPPRNNTDPWGVTEYLGTGDPYFGGSADDRPLGKTGEFLTGFYRADTIAEFPTQADAIAAAKRAKTRPGSLVSVYQVWK